MRARLAALAWSFLGCSTLALAACGDGSADLVNPGPSSSTPRTTDDVILDTYRRQMTQVYTMVDTCQNDRTDACFRRVQASLQDGVQPQRSAIQLDDSVGQRNWLDDRLREVQSFSKENICPAVSYVVEPAEKYGDALRVYFVLGATGAIGAVGQAIMGAELTWELTQHEASGFTYSGGGIGNSIGASVGAYGSFAFSGSGGNIVGNWSGYFVGASLSLSIPFTRIGVGASAYCSFDPASPQRTCYPDKVVGVAIQASIGLDIANVLAVQGGVSQTYYGVDRYLVQYMHGGGWLNEDRDDHVKYNPAYNLSAGAVQAVDILFYGPLPPQLAAALTAVGIDAAKAGGKSLSEWCASEQNDKCPGRPDGMHCSTFEPRAAFLCQGDSNVGADSCPEGEHCVESGGNTLQCAPDTDAGR